MRLGAFNTQWASLHPSRSGQPRLATVKLRPQCVALQLDARGAFDSICRKAVLQETSVMLSTSNSFRAVVGTHIQLNLHQRRRRRRLI